MSDQWSDQATVIGRNASSHYGHMSSDKSVASSYYGQRTPEKSVVATPKRAASTPAKHSTAMISIQKLNSSVNSNTFTPMQRTTSPIQESDYHPLPDDRTTVVVHKKNQPGPKTSVITVKKEISDEDEDMISIDCLKNMFADGPISFRLIVCFTCIFMVIANVIDLRQESYYGEITIAYNIASLYVWCFAIFVISLEIRPFKYTLSEIHKEALFYVKVLRFTWGRAFFYFFSGSVQFLMLTKWNMIAGLTMMAMGFISIAIGLNATPKLQKLIRKIGTIENLEVKFSKYDKDRDGYLDTMEFGSFVSGIGVNMGYDEFVSTFSAIDRNNDRMITREELTAWFVRYKYHDKNPTFALV
mmetsp:Transcript_24196/g.29783  ORF Transcript_24196/g.29783 Transcript_24196/m.29783 type:complete len:357 (+) Transcript_24196:175-1245(+)